MIDEKRLAEIESFIHGRPASEALRSYVVVLLAEVRRLREALTGVRSFLLHQWSDGGLPGARR